MRPLTRAMLDVFLAARALGAFRYKPQSTNPLHHAKREALVQEVLRTTEHLESLC